MIRLEFASIASAYGTKVTVFEYCAEILPNFDSYIAKRLRTYLGRRGIDVIVGAEVMDISGDPPTAFRTGSVIFHWHRPLPRFRSGGGFPGRSGPRFLRQPGGAVPQIFQSLSWCILLSIAEGFSPLWLIRIGLNGQEFKNCRKHLLSHLEGNIAWLHQEDAIAQRERLKQERIAVREQRVEPVSAVSEENEITPDENFEPPESECENIEEDEEMGMEMSM